MGKRSLLHLCRQSTGGWKPEQLLLVVLEILASDWSFLWDAFTVIDMYGVTTISQEFEVTTGLWGEWRTVVLQGSEEGLQPSQQWQQAESWEWITLCPGDKRDRASSSTNPLSELEESFSLSKWISKSIYPLSVQSDKCVPASRVPQPWDKLAFQLVTIAQIRPWTTVYLLMVDMSGEGPSR